MQCKVKHNKLYICVVAFAYVYILLYSSTVEPPKECLVIVCLDLSLDYSKNELWWISKRNESYQIFFCRLGSLRDLLPCDATVFLPNSNRSGILTALTVDNNVIYYALGGQKATLESVNKNGTGHRVLREHTPGVTALKIYKKERLVEGMHACLVIGSFTYGLFLLCICGYDWVTHMCMWLGYAKKMIGLCAWGRNWVMRMTTWLGYAHAEVVIDLCTCGWLDVTVLCTYWCDWVMHMRVWLGYSHEDVVGLCTCGCLEVMGLCTCGCDWEMLMWMWLGYAHEDVFELCICGCNLVKHMWVTGCDWVMHNIAHVDVIGLCTCGCYWVTHIRMWLGYAHWTIAHVSVWFGFCVT